MPTEGKVVAVNPVRLVPDRGGFVAFLRIPLPGLGDDVAQEEKRWGVGASYQSYI
ncbi:MAG: hypothetical protein ACYC1C_11220 [Chloroflexota bacterium]